MEFSFFFIELLAFLWTFATSTEVNPPLSTPESAEVGCSPKYVTYTAAVLEYEPYNRYSDDPSPSGNEVLRQNAMAFRDYAQKAKQQGADILIAPEYGLQSLYLDLFDTEKMLSYAQYVPHPKDKINPFLFRQSKPTDSTHTTAMVILSEAAKDNRIYMVVNLLEVVACATETIPNSPFSSIPLENCPESGYVFYNTQVVFDRSGVVIARYRKQHLYFPETFDASGPKDDDSAIFVTDFDVAFSTQVCYDVLFEHPGPSNVRRFGIKDVAMSTAWVDAAPYFLADEIHNGFGQGLGINFIVSGHHQPERGELGSGIYRWFKDGKVDFVYNKDSGDVMLVANVSTVAKSYLASSSHKKEWDEYQARVEGPRNFEEEKKVLVGQKWDDRFDKEPMVGAFDPPEKTADGIRGHLIRHDDISHFTITPLPPTEGEQKTVNACNNNFCCELKYSYNGNKAYKLLVDGVGSKDCCFKVASRTCSVVMCPDESGTRCTFPAGGFSQLGKFGPFELSATYEGGSPLVYPEAISGKYQLLNNEGIVFEQDEESKKYSLKSNGGLDDVMVLALFGRDFDRDLEDHLKGPLNLEFED